MSLTEKMFAATGSGLFFGATFWLWADTGEAVFVNRVLAFAQTCL